MKTEVENFQQNRNFSTPPLKTLSAFFWSLFFVIKHRALKYLHHCDIVNLQRIKGKEVKFVFKSKLDTEEHQTEATVNRLNFGAWKIG